MAQFDYSDFFLFWFWKIKMANENNVDGVQENVEEPIPEKVINSMSKWTDLLKDPSRSRILTLFLNVIDEVVNEPLSITGNDFRNLKTLTVNDISFGRTRRITITGLDNLESVTIGNYCFNEPERKSKNSIFNVTNCRNLKTITVGEQSLKRLRRFEVFDNPRLESITWEKGSFDECDVFSFSGTLVFSQ